MKTNTAEVIKIKSGEKVAVFPLPNAILFPHVELPLFIFEPQYRKMLKDCMKGNNLMAVALLKKEWSSTKEPLPCHDMVGIGYIKICTDHTNGTSNIILKGICRARITNYVQMKPYRIARISPIEKSLSEEGVVWRARKLSKLFIEKLARTTRIKDEEIRSLENITDPEELSDFVAATTQIDSYSKQEILETIDLDKRMDLLINILESEIRDLKKRSS